MTTHRLTREIPVDESYDILVAGGGPAGTAAAVCAARLGAKVLLAEANGCLGGMGTHAFIDVQIARLGLEHANHIIVELERRIPPPQLAGVELFNLERMLLRCLEDAVCTGNNRRGSITLPCGRQGLWPAPSALSAHQRACAGA